ncbi:helix-turn-helix transcriptional regulator [Paenibacillus sp. N3/727]|uniref:helix-turn-helix domain-containing protein n=1 Tax=Paenibacillus sp. N3/727 TaxID=2925845 RepID=UPI001F536B8F|nr:helix-turn-helix transcriptional regulator [Paenibacillus sp. N3/727]UNK19505.1 helix-turn-helix transcriptional regulator [Paenibacillus sp. N3/727]
MKQSIAVRLGIVIREIRKSQNLTQEELAEKIGTSFSYIGRLERGEGNFTVQTLEKITNALNIDFFDFMSLGKRDNEILLEINSLLMQQDEDNQLRGLNILKELYRR